MKREPCKLHNVTTLTEKPVMTPKPKGPRRMLDEDEVSEVSDLNSTDFEDNDYEEELDKMMSSDEESVTTKKASAKMQLPAETSTAAQTQVAKTKQRDGSRIQEKNPKSSEAEQEENSDDFPDDEPLSKMVKKPPTDDQLKETVQKLLKNANLEEVTMKQIYKKVFEMYPRYDLSNKKGLLKQTVKKLLSQ